MVGGTSPPAVASLVFHIQPGGAVAGSPFTVQPVVWALDGMGALVTGFTGLIDISLDTGAGLLTGTNQVACVAGVATFTNLGIDTAGACELQAVEEFPLPQHPVNSASFTVATGDLLASIDITDPANIDSFTRATVAGYTGDGEAPFLHEAAIDVLRSAHYVDHVQCVLLETVPTQKSGASFSDDFGSGAESPIGSPWASPVGSSSQFNQTAGGKAEGEGSTSMAVVSTPDFSVDFRATANLDSNNGNGPAAITAGGSGYAANVSSSGDRVIIQKYLLGVYSTDLADITGLPPIGPTTDVSLDYHDSTNVTLELFLDGVSKGSVTDSTSPVHACQPAMQSNGFAALLSFEAADL